MFVSREEVHEAKHRDKMEMLNSLNVLAGKISPQNHDDNRMSGGGGVGGVDQPDPDAIKMFVGQIPRSMDENDLRKMFEDYGNVFQVNVLRDKLTGQSKGCCFVTFYKRKHALEAQNAMHNMKTMQGMHHPIQMKPADSENRNERKLFIGMLSKKITENDVRAMFAAFGTIEECTVLRDVNTVSRGCAFVTYTSRQSAVNAIKTMHHSQTMEGCSSPMVVKFADTQKEKDQKRIHQATASLWGGIGGIGNLTPQYLTAMPATNSAGLQQLGGLNALGVQQLLAASSQNSFASTQAALQSLANLQSQAGLSLAASNSQQTGAPDLNNLNAASIPGLAALANFTTNSNINAMNMQNLAALAAMASNGNASGLSTLSGSAFAHGDVIVPVSAVPGLVAAYSNFGGSSLNSGGTTAQGGGGSVSPLNGGLRQQEGPEGANLFIYHLPQEFGDNDLGQAFSPFGNILSAKVFIDKQTNLSKCFGFVSYDNAMSSQAAIQAMNGFQIGTKRLKVQLKRSKDASKPY